VTAAGDTRTSSHEPVAEHPVNTKAVV
jgi:hypothetical protein